MGIFNTIFFAVLVGVLPSVIWLTIWLKEDEEHPEPRKYILTAFFYGAVSVPVALILQLIFNAVFHIGNTESIAGIPFIQAFAVITVWAFIEEYIKYRAAWHSGLRKNITDEAVDVPIYMISAALGFAALENTLFLIAPLMHGTIQDVIITTKLRTIGATLVHVACSGLIGIFAGYSLFFLQAMRKKYVISGLILATLLHAMFNLFIIKGSQNFFVGFLLVWFFIILIVILFERIKKIKVNTINNVREKETKENTY